MQAVAVNKDIWDELPADIQAILETGVRRLALDVMYQYEMQDFAAVKKAKEEGVTVVDWPAEERAKFRKIAIDQWGSATEKSELAKKYADKVQEFLQSQGLVQE